MLQSVVQPLVRRVTDKGSKTPIQRAISLLRRFGSDAHLWLPGVGTLNGLTTGNYLESTGNSIATVDNPVGLVLDALGSVGVELVTNGDFSNGPTGFTFQSNATPSVASNTLTVVYAGSSNGATIPGYALTVNSTYKVSITHQSPSGSVLNFYCGGEVKALTGTGAFVTETIHFKAASTAWQIYPVGATGFTYKLKALSVREVSGIHAQQATTANKPVLRRGLVNLLTYSSDFSNAAWTKGGTSIVGTKVVEAASTSAKNVSITSLPTPMVVGVTYTLAARVKAAERQFAYLQGLGTFAKSYFDLSAGTVSASGSGNTSTIAPAEDGSYIICISFVCDSVATSVKLIGMSQVSGTSSYTGDGTSGINLYSALLTPGTLTAAQILAAGGIPVTTSAAASNPDSGRYSWSFDGSNDSLASTFTAGTLSSNMDCFVVLRRNSAGNLVVIYEDASGSKFVGVAVSAGTTGMLSAGVAAGVTPSFYVDGLLVGTYPSITRDQLHLALSVGSSHVLEIRNINLSDWTGFAYGNYPVYTLNGSVHEVVLTAAMSDADRTLIRSYLASKHGITI